MELFDKSLNFEKGMNSVGMECKITVDCELGAEKDYRNMYIDLEERCSVLESEVQKNKNEFELLARRFRALEVEKIAVEDDLKKKNGELEELINKFKTENAFANERGTGKEGMVDLTDEKDEEEKVQLMIENKVMESEKKRAESEVEVWKSKCRELESRVLQDRLGPSQEKIEMGLGLTERDPKEIEEEVQAEGNVLDSDQTAFDVALGSTLFSPTGTSLTETPSTKFTSLEGRKRGTRSATELEYGGRVLKQLQFGKGSPSKAIAPSTPGGARPSSLGVIDITDSDDERDITNLHMPTLEIQGNKVTCASTDCALVFTSNNKLKRTVLDQSDDEADGSNGNFPYIPTPKRKRASNIVTSDSESDDDDIPICKLKRKDMLKSCSVNAAVPGDEVTESVNPSRRLVRLRKREVDDEPERLSSTNSETGEEFENEVIGDNGSDTESDGLGGFIVDSSDVSAGDDASGDSDEESDENVDFGEIMSKIRRKRDEKSKWEFEADMLAAFGKDPVLCMKAVCALYRQQTCEEKSFKGTFFSNHRGFSQCDAFRGSNLAEFLTDGDPKGDLIKSVEELQEYDTKGTELCRTLATHYSKQLFAIYNNKEDPFFTP